MRRSTLLSLACFASLSFSTAFASPVGINQLVVFGDSLSDNGNASILSNGAFPGPNYAPGMFTDGPNTNPSTSGPFGLWVDQFAGKIGVAEPTPFLAGGTNFAVASADTGYTSPQDLGYQVQAYLASTGGKQLSPTTLYTFWAGANDIADKKSGKAAADAITLNILTLSAAGAKNFLWLNLPPLGETPNGMAANMVVPGTSAALNAQSSAFNGEWQGDLYKLSSDGVNVISVNIDSLFQEVAANYAAGCTPGAANPYCFTNITSPAQGQTGQNPNDFLYWDGQHPTTAADALVADAAYGALLAAPEPAGFALVLTGLGLVGFAIRRKKIAAEFGNR